MKKIVSICSIIIFLALNSASADYNGEITLGNIRGDIVIYSDIDGKITLDNSNYPVFKRDRIITKNGTGELTMLSGASIKVMEDSSIEISDYTSNNLYVNIHNGSFYVRCLDTSKIDLILSDRKILCSSRSAFYLKKEQDNTLRVNIHSGTLSVYTANNYFTLKTGDDIIFDAFGIKRLADTSPARWETHAHIYQDNYPSTSYLPHEISIYTNTLNRYGKWVYVTEYGYCWIPIVVNINTWTPFSCGRYIKRHGRTIWISCEPWGWVSHHYGRWVFHNHYGWIWIPPSRQRIVWHPYLAPHREVIRERVYIREETHKPPVIIHRDRRPPHNTPHRPPVINRNDHIKPPPKPPARENYIRPNPGRHERNQNYQNPYSTIQEAPDNKKPIKRL